MLSDAGVSPEQVLGIGVGVPGIVEPGADGVIHAKTFGWDGVPLGALLRRGTSLPLYVDNGAKTMGQAELWFGSGRGASEAVIVLLGVGVGATIVADGTTFRGVSSSAGEWGHTKIVANGRPCRCGGRGCLEAYIGIEAILDRAGVTSRGDWEEDLAGVLASNSSVVEETVTYLGVGLANLVNLINPEKIVIGGWVGVQLGESLLPDIRRATAANSLAEPYAATSIVLGRLGPDAVALGAATLVLEEFLNAPQVARITAAGFDDTARASRKGPARGRALAGLHATPHAAGRRRKPRAWRGDEARLTGPPCACRDRAARRSAPEAGAARGEGERRPRVIRQC